MASEDEEESFVNYAYESGHFKISGHGFGLEIYCESEAQEVNGSSRQARFEEQNEMGVGAFRGA